MSEIAIVQGKLPSELKAAIEILQKAKAGEHVPPIEREAAKEMLWRYGLIGVSGEAIPFARATVSDLQSVSFPTEMWEKHIEFALGAD